MKWKEEGASQRSPRWKPSSFFISLRLLRILAGLVVAVSSIGLLSTFFWGNMASDTEKEIPESVRALHEGPRTLSGYSDPHELDALSGRLARDLADRVRFGEINPARLELQKKEAEAENAPESPDETQEKSAVETTPPSSLLVIVIDDLGENLSVIKSLIRLPYPVTLAIWPGASHAARAAETAHAAGRKILVHMPMQPRDSRHTMGAFGLSVGMAEKRLSSYLRESLSRVPHAVGINNHMGSRFTSDEASVNLFCRELAAQAPGFFVLDSLTLDTSVLYEQAKKYGFTAFRRDVFLDETQNKKEVLRQLDKAAELAGKNGMAVAIGHPYPTTLAALASWKGYRNPEISVGDFPVSASSLSEHSSTSQ